MKTLGGGCHCGNIVFELTWRGDPANIPARVCGCTFCARHGAVWTSHPPSSLDARIVDASRVSRYAFGTHTATFHVCATCGVVPFVTSLIDGRVHAVVNVNCLEDVDPSSLCRMAANFDGEAFEARLARRSRGWIADVRIVEGPVDRANA